MKLILLIILSEKNEGEFAVMLGIECWFKDSKYYRENGPAVTLSDGEKQFFDNGKSIVNLK